MTEKVDLEELEEKIQTLKQAEEAKLNQQPKRHLFCRPCFNEYLRMNGAEEFAGFATSEYKTLTTSGPPTNPNSANNEANCDAGNTSDSEGSQASQVSEYIVGSDIETLKEWPKCPLCTFYWA